MATNPVQTRTLAILFFTLGTVLLDRMASLFLGPYLVAALHLTPSQVGWLASASSICWAASSLVFGAVSDRLGRRVVLIPAVFLFSICSWLSGIAQNFEQLLLCRALLGLAEGPCWSVIMALTEEISEDGHRGRNIGIVNSAGPLVGSAVAPVFTTQVAAALGWQWGFFAAGIPGIVLGFLILRYVDEPPRRAPAAGTATASTAASFLSLVRYGNLWLCVVASFGLATWVFSFTTFAPLYITSVMHQAGTTAGLLLGAGGLGGFLWSFFGAGLADRMGRKPALAGFALLCTFSPLVFMVPFLYDTPWVIAALAFATTATPAAASLAMILIPAESVPRHYVAAAIGFAGIGAEFLGATLSPILGGMLAERYGLSAAMLYAVGGGILLFVMALLIRETGHRGEVAVAAEATVGDAARRAIAEDRGQRSMPGQRHHQGTRDESIGI